MEIYSLKPQDNPLYDGLFKLDQHPSLKGNKHLVEDFKGIDRRKFAWKAHQLAEVWTTPQVRGDVAAYNDYPADGSTVPVFSEKAVEALRPLLEPNGELLPLDSKVGRFFAFNVTSKCEALDIDKSTGYFGTGDKETAMSISNYAFDELKFEDYAIFRLREEPVKLFATAEFKTRAEEASLTAMEFVKVWPLREGVQWNKERKKVSQMRAELVAPYQKQTVYVALGLAGKQATEEEEDRVIALGSELGEYLAVEHNTSEAEFVGNTKHFDESRKTAYIVLVGPDADRLAEAIIPWVESIDWPRSVSVIKKYGVFSDKAKRVTIKVK